MELTRFEELLGAELDGDLTEEEKAELIAACGSDASLARRRRQDQALAAILSRVPGERAPEKLSPAVMTKIPEEAPLTMETDSSPPADARVSGLR